MKRATLDRLIKFMSSTTSPSDGESLTAMRMANRILTAEGLTWERVLNRSIQIVGQFEAAPDEEGS